MEGYRVFFWWGEEQFDPNSNLTHFLGLGKYIVLSSKKTNLFSITLVEINKGYGHLGQIMGC
jgi:hypothetical protein